MTANSNKSKQGNKAAHRVIAGVLCGASVLSLVLSLVMPPISQAIANDAQPVSTEKPVMGGGSSSESTGVDDTNNGDTENQNSDETEGDETGDDAQSEGQSEEEQQNEGTTTSDGETVAAVAENEQTKAAAEGIDNASELKNKLESVAENQSGSFKLMKDLDCSEEIFLNKKGSNITLDLNGCKIKHSGEGNKPLFSVSNGAEFTITDFNPGKDEIADTQPLQNQGQDLTAENYGKTAEMSYVDDVPTKLTYYVTKSSVDTTDSTRTNETTDKHEVTINGAIVGTKDSAMRLINVYTGGTFNLQCGVLTTTQNAKVGNLIYAENGSTVNMSGGYVCGATSTGQGAGIELKDKSTTLNLTGGVIAGNHAPNGGGVYAKESAVTVTSGVISGKVTSGVISGNSTLGVGLGGGIMAEGGIVTVSGGYITNNRMAKFCGTDGNGDHGGGGLAANNGAHVTISDGQITGNYSEEAGGGVYVTNLNQSGMAWLNITGGNIASNVSYRSEGAGIRVGQMVDAMISVPEENSVNPVYITNNTCLSRFDWGGGGIFVQGDTKTASNAGRLFVYNSYISSNTAGGYGGGVAVCPSGKTLVTNTYGTAIFGNTDAGDASGYDNTNNKYNPSDNTGNNGSPHLSGGGDHKDEDKVAYESVDKNNEHVFRNSGHADFFLAAEGHTTPVAVVTGKMLGDIDAEYSGSIELTDRITIPANGVAQVKNSIGLTSGVSATDETTTEPARKKATTFITGNYSWDHGGGIMSNGDLYLGQPADTYVYPSLKLKASKALKNKQTNESMALAKDQFSFSVYRKDSATATMPSWNDKTFDNGGCTLVGTAKNDVNGNITFDLGEQLIDKTVEANEITYYLVENAGEVSGVTYDPAVYEIEVTLEDHTTVLMSVPTQNNPNATKDLKVHNYKIKSVNAIKNPGGSSDSPSPVSADVDGYYSIANSDGSKTFTNKYTPYTSTGSWTPKATKVVEGGEMKEFTLEFADNDKFTGAETVKTKANSKKSQTLDFHVIKYKLNQLDKLESDPTGRGASKTFTYYVREQLPTTPFTNYTYDRSVYKITVNATDQSNKTIKCEVTYTKIVDADGEDIPEAKQKAVDYVPVKDVAAGKNQSVPVFTNAYSTTLPLSGMSGVTLTYLAGAAVLCAAAAWMHIRRKANAKGGERRE